MKPSELSSRLRRIATFIETSQRPDRSKVISALSSLISHVASGDDLGDEITKIFKKNGLTVGDKMLGELVKKGESMDNDERAKFLKNINKECEDALLAMKMM
jgi:hypothetical protein